MNTVVEYLNCKRTLWTLLSNTFSSKSRYKTATFWWLQGNISLEGNWSRVYKLIPQRRGTPACLSIVTLPFTGLHQNRTAPTSFWTSYDSERNLRRRPNACLVRDDGIRRVCCGFSTKIGPTLGVASFGRSEASHTPLAEPVPSQHYLMLRYTSQHTQWIDF